MNNDLPQTRDRNLTSVFQNETRTPWCRVFLEKLGVRPTQLVKKFP